MMILFSTNFCLVFLINYLNDFELIFLINDLWSCFLINDLCFFYLFLWSTFTNERGRHYGIGSLERTLVNGKQEYSGFSYLQHSWTSKNS